MPTPKNGFQILNLHSKKHVLKKKFFLMYFCLSFTKKSLILLFLHRVKTNWMVKGSCQDFGPF